MHVHMKPILLQHPTPQPAKAPPSPLEARDVKRVNGRLGGGGRGNPQHQQPDRRANERREEDQTASSSPVAALAMTLAALDLARATEERVPVVDDTPPAPRALSIADLLMNAVPQPDGGT